MTTLTCRKLTQCLFEEKACGLVNNLQLFVQNKWYEFVLCYCVMEYLLRSVTFVYGLEHLFSDAKMYCILLFYIGLIL